MSHELKCLSVTIRFNKPHMSGQVIRLANGPTASQYIRVEHSPLRLALHFMNKNEQTLRSICFNANDVGEYDCENVVDAGKSL